MTLQLQADHQAEANANAIEYVSKAVPEHAGSRQDHEVLALFQISPWVVSPWKVEQEIRREYELVF